MAKQQTAAKPGVSVRRVPPAAILAAIAGVLLLLDAALWVLTAGAEPNATVVTQTVIPCLLLLSGIAALCGARVVREAPRWAALLCAAAIVPVTIVHLVPALVYLSRPQPSFPPAEPDFTPSLLTWLVVVTPLAVSIVLALRQPRTPREPAQWSSMASCGRHGL
jgi:uncharacterized membrane protein HdeD (DUF308 family)